MKAATGQMVKALCPLPVVPRERGGGHQASQVRGAREEGRGGSPGRLWLYCAKSAGSRYLHVSQTRAQGHGAFSFTPKLGSDSVSGALG